jgi:predicted RNase H-like HicB family nuclease
MRYAVVIEKAKRNYSAYLPDLPGCVATGDTVGEVMDLLREGIKIHIQGLIEYGLDVPSPTSSVEYIAVQDTRKD